ncbi:MAG: UDP-N-acetylmuramoyl-tripeptide--D-alanyl-D-alanine ligase [Planctomycetota bacterium]|jgi:UDP-N-acetylmuramoyl-tripeptide--D-alanyl-D-alanine ligase
MKKFSIEALAQIIKAEPTENANGFFTGVSIDSRTTKAGDCFFAIEGENFNGADFVSDVFTKGAVCAVVNHSEAQELAGNPLLKVDDTVRALGDFAAEYRRQSNFKVVAITGSVGKTTTRQIAYHILHQHFRVCQAPKNFNNFIGLPLTLLGADPEEGIVLAELAANHPGEIAYLTRIAQPNIAVVINIHPAHLAGFGDLQTIAQEKLSIAEGLQPDGVLIINADFEQLLGNCRKKSTKFVTFGKSKDAFFRVRDIVYNDVASTFTIDVPLQSAKPIQVYLPLPGAGNVENALAACSICSQFGIKIDDFAQEVKTLPPVSMRAEFMQAGTLTILNDCYNANPASMKNALDILVRIGNKQKQRCVFICGDMAELGHQTEQFHLELGTSVAQAEIQLLLIVGSFAKIAAEAAKRTAKYDLQTETFEDALSACNNLEKFIKDYDIILVKGSRIAGLEIVVQRLKELFA